MAASDLRRAAPRPSRASDAACTYRVYGLRVRSAFALPELDGCALPPETADEAYDVLIRTGSVPPLKPVEGASEGSFYATPRRVVLDYPDVALFDVHDGREIVVAPAPGGSPVTMRMYLLGIGLAVALHQRGLLVLHAGGVDLGGQAVLFVGEKGAGKSTFTATLNDRGHPFVTDDIAPVHLGASPDAATVAPGFLQQKLWPDAARFLGRSVDDLPRLHESVDKRFDSVRGRVAPAPLALAAIYVLDYGDALAVEPLTGYRAFQEVVRHTFINQQVVHTTGAAHHFRACNDLLQTTGVYRLQRPKDLSQIGAAAALVEAHHHETRGRG